MTLFSKISLAALIIAVVMVLADLSLAWLLVPLLLWLLFTSIGSFHMRWNYFLQATHRNKDAKNSQISLTFDDGPHPEFTPQILKLLDQYNMKASFFCIGKQLAVYPEIVQQIHQAGHGIGNHSTSHSKRFGFFTSSTVLAEIKQCDDLILKSIGVKNKYFRPPFGVTNPAIAKALKSSKHQVIGWSVRSYDTLEKSPEQILDTVVKSLHGGDIVLLHDTNQRTVEALRLLLPVLQERNLPSVAIETLLSTQE